MSPVKWSFASPAMTDPSPPKAPNRLRSTLRAIAADTPSQPPDKAGVVDPLHDLCARTEADAVSALRYIEKRYGRLDGVGWDRVFNAHDELFRLAALSPPPASGSPEWDWVYRHSPPPADECPFCALMQQKMDAASMLMGEGFIQALHAALDQKGAPRGPGDGTTSTYGLVQRIHLVPLSPPLNMEEGRDTLEKLESYCHGLEGMAGYNRPDEIAALFQPLATPSSPEGMVMVPRAELEDFKDTIENLIAEVSDPGSGALAAHHRIKTILTVSTPPKNQKWKYTGSHLDRDGGGNG